MTHQGAHNAATAGVASIEHGFGMTDDDLEIAKKNDVVLVGTEYLGPRDAKAGPQWIDRLRRAFKIGVTWIEAGIPPKVLLQAMTMNAARLLGVEKERGAIRTGMAADLLMAT